MYAYKVGAPYSTTRSRWPETPILQLVDGGHALTLFLETPTRDERQAVRNGVAEFAWIDAGLAGLLAYRFAPGLPWSDCPYTPHREEPGATAHVPAAAEGEHLLVQVAMVDAATGIVAALRQVTWPAAFVNVVGDSVRRMAGEPYNGLEFELAVARLYGQYPGPEGTARLVADRAVATCVGGR